MEKQDKSDHLINENDREYIEFTREKAYYDRMSWMNYLKRVEQEAYKKAKQEAYEKAKQEAYEKAKQEEILTITNRLLQSKIDLDIIVKCTGLSIEEIQALKDNKY